MTVGIYIHIPFCQSRCNYCHFITRPWDEAVEERYYRALLKELTNNIAGIHQDVVVDTIYFGGGTPSLMPAPHLSEVLSTCRRLFSVSSDCEVTLEANPGTVSSAKAAAYRELGVNRISMGAQSFADNELTSIGRVHNALDVEESLAAFRGQGFENINLDLMLGLPGQSAGTWRRNLAEVARLGPQHISVYMLDLDDKTPLYHEIAKGLFRTPDEDSVSDWYLETIDCLAGHGYDQYEISNFARPGSCSRHNLKYWLREPVLAFGVGSHSFDGVSRYANYSNLNTYLQHAEAAKSPVEWRRNVDALQAIEESLFLGLRLNRGVDLNHLKVCYGSEQLSRYETSLRNMCDEGLVEIQGFRARLTPQGMLLSNEVFQQFV